MRNVLRYLLIVALVSILAVDPATACRFCAPSRYYAPPCGGCAPCYPVEEHYVVETYHSSCCGCDACGEGDVYEASPQYDHEYGPTEPPMERAPTMAPSAPPEPPQRDRVFRPTEPMTPPALPPTAEPAERDRFTEEPDDDLFGTPAAPPERVPAEEEDDLFGPTTDEEEPAPAEPEDDLFNAQAEEPRDEMPPSEPEAETDDLFDTATPPEDDTTPAEEPSAEEEDELFGPPADDQAPPAEEEDEDEAAPAEEEDVDFFGDFGAILREPGGLASAELRRWVDDTGRYSCRGRLIRTLDGKVQLRKDNGRISTVPLSRLSQGDLEFVHRQAGAQVAENLGKTAQAFRSH